MRKLSLSAIHFIKRSAFLKLLLKIGLTFAAFWFIFYEMDFERIGAIVSKQNPSILLIVFLFTIIQTIMGAVRWRMIIPVLGGPGNKGLTVWESLRLTYIGIFFNICLPGGTVGGDAIRIWLTKAEGVSLSVAIHSVIIDRIIALSALAIMVWIGLPWIGEMAGFNGTILAVALVPLALVGLWLVYNVQRIMTRMSHVSFVNQLLHFLSSIRAILSHGKVSLSAVLYALVGHILYCIAMTYLADSLGIDLTITNSLLLLPPVVLAALLPISIGGWGIREFVMIMMLALIHVSQEEALVLSLEGGLISMVNGLPGGLIWLLDKKHVKAKHIMKDPAE